MLCPRAPLHEAIQPASIRKHAAQYLKNGSKFPDWKNDPFTALVMYKQLEEAFGWDAFKKAITAYQKLPALPRSNPQKQDQWMIEMSRATGKNLAPFFTYWGIPLTDAARAQVKDLAAWQFPDPTK
jgi:hypothetical protein